MKISNIVFLLCTIIPFSSLSAQEVKDMAITVNAYYTGDGDNARKFAEEMESSGTAAAIRAEPGNKKYEYFFPKNDEHTVLLIDSWENQAALDKHHASPMMKTIADLREKYDLHMTYQRYIEDPNGFPESDKAFVRE